MEYNLLQKTEIWISPLLMNEVNLGVCARIAANVLSLEPHEVMVTDVLEDTMTLDVLVPTIEAEKIVGREKDLLAALATVPGVQVTAETQVHSQGILGFIALDEEQGKEVLERSRAMTAEISERIRKRSLVFSSGAELLAGQIRDTNTPFLIEGLKAEGYNASQGKTLQDDADVIARAFREASETGYGLMVTTGGVGAESKDQTLEALRMVDPDASTPYILKFEKGTGRHHKEGVRIGVGMAGRPSSCASPVRMTSWNWPGPFSGKGCRSNGARRRWRTRWQAGCGRSSSIGPLTPPTATRPMVEPALKAAADTSMKKK